jgi:hypothetical protein
VYPSLYKQQVGKYWRTQVGERYVKNRYDRFMLWTSIAVGAAAPRRTINLNKPGALEAIELSNPTHCEKIRDILNGIIQQAEVAVSRWTETNFDARNMRYSAILKPSGSPKRRRSFALDGTRYEAVVTLTHGRAEIVP